MMRISDLIWSQCDNLYVKRKMALCFKLLVLFFIADKLYEVRVNCKRNDDWSKPLILYLHARNRVAASMHDAMQNIENIQLIENALLAIRYFPQKLENFEMAEFNALEDRNAGNLKFLPRVLEENEITKIPELFLSYELAEYYQNNIANVIEYIGEKTRNFLDSKKKTHFQLPTDSICSRIVSFDPPQEISITKICPDVMSCSSEKYPYGNNIPGMNTDVSKACTSDKKCDLRKALPMMAGVLWYKISHFFLQTICRNQCLLSSCKYLVNRETLIHESNLYEGFLNLIPHYFDHFWKTFFTEAIQRNSFSDLDTALSLVEGKKEQFRVAPLACNVLKSESACPYADILKEALLIKKIQKYRMQPGPVKDLRLFPNVDHAKMIEIQRNSFQHIQLLGSIKRLDDNLQASVSGISAYFTGLAKYDEGIADADVLFIQGELNKYEKAMAEVEKKLKADISKTMTLMKTTAIANAAEQAGILAAKIIEYCNPLKIIFGGIAVGDLYEQAGKVADAATVVVKATALFTNLNALQSDSVQIGNAFNGGEGSNRQQITSLKAVVDKIRSGAQLDADADKFVEEYGEYTPQTDRSSLAHNNELWSAYKDAACDIVNGEVGIAGAIPKAIAGGMLICETLDGTLAQFFALREDIFDFQFQLVDAVAKVVRGNIAKRLSNNIKGKGDILAATELMIGSFMIQSRLQTHASLYCDKLEYQNLGRPVAACSTVNGIFNQDNIGSLIAYTDHSRYDKFDRDVYIPTRPRNEGDTGYIDLQALGKGEKIVFKLPVDNAWLQDYRWLVSGETSAPFVESFKIFLPLKEYPTGADQEQTTTRVVIRSIAGSRVSSTDPNTGVSYALPPGHSTYTTVYEEGYASCPKQREIDNPYSLCDNLPKICDQSERNTGQSLLPTILSTWSLSVSYMRGSKQLKWNFPSSATNLLIRAKVTLRMRSSSKKRSIIQGIKISDVVRSPNGCCEDNRYRTSLYNRNCEPCPENSTSFLGGLYCEITDNPHDEMTKSKKKFKFQKAKKEKKKKKKKMKTYHFNVPGK